MSNHTTTLRFQSTLPRRERHWTEHTKDIKRLISIHAPAKGATADRYYSAPESTISIHAPAKGATLYVLVYKRSNQFQSTLPRRERQQSFASFPAGLIFQSTLPRRERQHLLTSFRLQYGYSLFHLTNKI